MEEMLRLAAGMSPEPPAIVDDDTIICDVESTSSAPKKAASTTKRGRRSTVSSKKRLKPDKWSPDTVTTDDKSPLASYSIKNILLHPRAWDCLTRDVQETIVKLSPPGMFVAQLDGSFKPDQNFLRNNSDFAHGAAEWREDLITGKNDAAWQRDAMVASQQRRDGVFDDFKEKAMEEYWGQNKEF